MTPTDPITPVLIDDVAEQILVYTDELALLETLYRITIIGNNVGYSEFTTEWYTVRYWLNAC